MDNSNDKPVYTHAEYVCKELYQLQQEVLRHPDLLEKAKEVSSFSESIGLVAAHCNIMLDGNYSQEDLRELYVVLRNKLEAKRDPVEMQSKIWTPPGV